MCICVQVGGVKTLAHLTFGNDVNRIEVRATAFAANQQTALRQYNPE